MKCPTCGSENPDYAFYCGTCAGELPRMPQKESPGCPRCGKANPEGQKFCGYCGARLGPADESQTSEDDQSEPGWLEPGSSSYGWMALDWKIRWAALMIVGLVMGIIFFVEGAKYDDPGLVEFAIFFLILGVIGAFMTWLNLKR